MEKTKLSKGVIQESLDKRGSAKERKVVKQEKKVNTINECLILDENYTEPKSEMKEVIDLMKEIRDLMKKFVESVEIQ